MSDRPSPDRQEIVDAFTDTPQSAPMMPADKDRKDRNTDAVPTDDLTVQGGE